MNPESSTPKQVVSPEWTSESIHFYWLSRLPEGEGEVAPEHTAGEGGTAAEPETASGVGKGRGGVISIDDMANYFKAVSDATGGGSGRAGGGVGGGEVGKKVAGVRDVGVEGGRGNERGGGGIPDIEAKVSDVASRVEAGGVKGSVIEEGGQGGIVAELMKECMAGADGEVPRGLMLALQDLEGLGGDWFSEDVGETDIMTLAAMRGEADSTGGERTGLQDLR